MSLSGAIVAYMQGWQNEVDNADAEKKGEE